MQSRSGSICDTPAYMAPETLGILSPVQLSLKSDIFAFGMVLYELIERRPPFEKQNAVAITTAIMHGHRPKFERESGNIDHPSWLYNFVEVCWKHDRDDRPTIQEVKRILELRKCPLSPDDYVDLKSNRKKIRSNSNDIELAIYDHNSYS
eukprot:CAMPEP_0204827632 /NCGR_PEP_ID=MMETSP1346-20131115/5051_1 /ASSEMBLY_ACC=CAM_ASM_000771 /TAXON_ID=215587 /ORGANISM="Aplanochytrium stocchinoi, Strain GSBS06" /LENGTH=149 /DNA_ID=CAMNT_0051956129 /DNA_START=316 /DNA_END=765 /DNA_ORIENTATION=+